MGRFLLTLAEWAAVALSALCLFDAVLHLDPGSLLVAAVAAVAAVSARSLTLNLEANRRLERLGHQLLGSSPVRNDNKGAFR